LHDGESAPSKKHVAGLFGGTPFATLAELERDWKAWAGVRKGGGMKEIDDNCLSLPAGHIREVYSNPGWIAIGRDGGGNALGVDLDPGPMGTVGQVITFGRDIERKHVLAPSLPVFVERLAELIRKKQLDECSDDDDPFPTLTLHRNRRCSTARGLDVARRTKHRVLQETR
jgi:cell wall assembly regulator SMI1